MAEKQNEVKYSVDLPKRSGKSNLTLSLDKITAFLDDGKEAYQVCSDCIYSITWENIC